MEINKTTLKTFRSDFADAVKDLEKQYGVQIQLGSISYSGTEFHSKMTAKNLNASGEVEDKSFETCAWMFNLKPEWKNVEFEVNGEVLKAVGLNSRRPKNPVVLQSNNGKTYKASADFLKFHMAQAKA